MIGIVCSPAHSSSSPPPPPIVGTTPNEHAPGLELNVDTIMLSSPLPLLENDVELLWRRTGWPAGIVLSHTITPSDDSLDVAI